MKRYGIRKNFMTSMMLMGICIVLLWIVFYLITRRAIIQNMTIQAEAVSDSIIMSVENELLSIEDTSYELAGSDDVVNLACCMDTGEFYERGSQAAKGTEGIIGNYCPADHVIVFRSDGLFYRIKGRMPNTTLKRTWVLLERYPEKPLILNSNDTSYVGFSKRIEAEGQTAGYVVLFMGESRLENLLYSFKDLDYLGAVITADDRVICTNSDLPGDSTDAVINESIFYRERAIGLSGISLLIFFNNIFTSGMENYFRVAMPAAILILVGIMIIFTRFVRIKDVEIEREKNLISLLKKQISAHFTVNTLNVVRALVNSGQKEEASRTCTRLSSLLRYANAADEYITLLEELYILRQYADIMQTRYPGRFKLEISEDDSFESVNIPRMLLQPIVENSIIHGYDGSCLTITVSAEVSRDVVILIRDNGCGIERIALEKLRDMLKNADTSVTAGEGISHVALQNIQKRIGMLFGEGYGITIESERKHGTSVMLKLPRLSG